MKWRNTIIIFLLLNSFKSFSQGNLATNYTGWYQYFGNHILNAKWNLHTELQIRRNNIITKPQQTMPRIGLDYKLNNANTLSFGYAFIITYPYGNQPVVYPFNEHRIWYQYFHTFSFLRMQIQQRFRFEKRFLETKELMNNEFVTDHWRYRNRIRYLVRFNIPLSAKSMSDKIWFLSCGNETFVQFGKNVIKNYFDQNRFFVNLGYRWDKNLNIQAGYLHHYILKSGAVNREQNHTFQISLTKNFDFSRKSEK